MLESMSNASDWLGADLCEFVISLPVERPLSEFSAIKFATAVNDRFPPIMTESAFGPQPIFSIIGGAAVIDPES